MYTNLHTYLSKVDKDTVVWLMDSMLRSDYSEVDPILKEIYMNELDTNFMVFSDDLISSLRSVILKEFQYWLAIRFNCLSPAFLPSASLIKPREIKFEITDEEAYNDIINQPELIFSL